MGIRLIHTSDWQIGKVFRFLDVAAAGQLQEARLGAISRIGELAREHGAGHVLVAGDVYDMEEMSPRSRNQPIERMRRFADVTWHLLPGNHDPHRPNGLWDRLIGQGLPTNVHAHIAPEPATVDGDGGGFALLPAPLFREQTLDDPTAWMDGAATPDGLVRVGMAHGTVTEFGSGGGKVSNLVAPDRPDRAGLAYLALGDWHGQKRIGARCWYSGTPETDGFAVAGGGRALLVEIDGPGAAPSATPLPTGRFVWHTLAATLASRDDVDALEQRLRTLDGTPERALVRLQAEGTLSLEDRQHFVERIVDGVAAAFAYMRVDDAGLFANPTSEDLDSIDRGGFVRDAANELKRMAAEGDGGRRGIAAAALLRLYVEHRKLEAERR